MRLSIGLVLALTAFASTASAADVTKDIADGVKMTTRTTATPNVARVLVVDLSAPGVHLGSTKTNERKRTTSSYAKLVGAAAAVNGDFFSYATYSTSGLAAGGGAQWSGTKDDGYNATIAFDGAKRIELSDGSKTVAFDKSWMTGVVSGHPQLVNGGTAIATNSTAAACNTRNPRSAVGMTADKKKLIVAVVDGRSSISAGMTCTELASLMKSFGADDAFNLDGGGSSTMYLRGTGIVNKPSDGTERVVANHLAIYAPRLGTVGSVKGLVHADGDKAKVLEGASVTLQAAGTDVTDATGRYELDTVPGKLSVTATAPGYAAKTMQVDVAAGADVTLDIGLAADPNASAPSPESPSTAGGTTTETSATDPASGADDAASGVDADAAADSSCAVTQRRSELRFAPIALALAMAAIAFRLRASADRRRGR